MNCGIIEQYTAWKVSKYEVFSGPYFPAFELNMERYEISLRIQSECGKIRTRKNSVFGHFSRSEITIFAKRSISDVWLTTWLGSECSSAFTSSDDNCNIISLKKEYLQNRILNKTKNKTKHNIYIRVKNNPISSLCIFVFIL